MVLSAVTPDLRDFRRAGHVQVVYGMMVTKKKHTRTHTHKHIHIHLVCRQEF